MVSQLEQTHREQDHASKRQHRGRGLAIECNRFAPAPTRADFVARTNLEGEAMTAEATKSVSSIRTEIRRHNSMQS